MTTQQYKTFKSMLQDSESYECTSNEIDDFNTDLLTTDLETLHYHQKVRTDAEAKNKECYVYCIDTLVLRIDIQKCSRLDTIESIKIDHDGFKLDFCIYDENREVEELTPSTEQRNELEKIFIDQLLNIMKR